MTSVMTSQLLLVNCFSCLRPSQIKLPKQGQFSFTGLLPLARPLLWRYYLIEQSQTWAGAQTQCRSQHSDLATVEGSTELLSLRDEALDKGFTRDAWIGLYQGGVWVWSLGNESLETYTKWSLAQPDNAAGNEDCVRFDWGGWADVTCIYKLPFTCYDS